MSPAQAFGTFVKYWRSQWAGLTQAQLAIAIGAHCRGQRVTERVVRRWEEGQPPVDIEELDALLTVMRKHGLSEPEIGHVRRAIFAACLDRHYAGLFIAEEFAQLPDVDVLAEGSLGDWPQAPASRDPVELVAQLESLERAVGRDLEPAAPGSQRRRQQAALAFVRQTMAWYCGVTDRGALGVRALAANLPYLDACFGSGEVGGKLSTLETRRQLAHAQCGLSRSDEFVPEQLEVSRTAEARGDLALAAGSFADALNRASAELRSTLYPQVERHLGGPPCTWDRVFAVAVKDGKWALAESILPHLEPLRHSNQWALQWWHQQMGPFAFHRGDLSEAEEHFAAVLRLHEELGGADALRMSLWLRVCEQARSQPGYDPARLEDEVEREVRRVTRARREWAGPALP
ncbi:MAG: helix-turn-helix domain-containing protein [Armatimonadota bacterium]